MTTQDMELPNTLSARVVHNMKRLVPGGYASLVQVLLMAAPPLAYIFIQGVHGPGAMEIFMEETSYVLGISFWIFLKRWLGAPQAPDWPLCVQSNTPDGVAFPLPLVAPSRTSAQEIRGADAPCQSCARDGAVSSYGSFLILLLPNIQQNHPFCLGYILSDVIRKPGSRQIADTKIRLFHQALNNLQRRADL